MKQFYLSWVFLVAVLCSNAQDLSVREVIIYDNLNPDNKVSGDSIVLLDTVYLGINLRNIGSGLLGPNDSVAIGFSVNGTGVGTYGGRVGTNLVPGLTADIPVGDYYQFTTQGSKLICAWNEYSPLGGDPNKSNDTACKVFTVYAPNRVLVTSFSPQEGYRGSEVIVDGSNFDTIASANTVTLNGVSATVKSATATKLTLEVPATATSGKIEVTAGGTTDISPNDFTVRIPEITGFNPTQGKVGDTVNISTTDVISKPDVKFNGVSASYVKHDADTVWAKVPTGATTGKVMFDFTVTTATSFADFTVTQDSTSSVEDINGKSMKVWYFDESIYLKTEALNYDMVIFDLNGNQVFEAAGLMPVSGKQELPLPQLKSAIYVGTINGTPFRFYPD